MTPRGRPTKINQPVATRDNPDGTTTTITVADRIVERLTVGAYMEEAASSAGVHKDTVYEWLKIGANARARIIAGTVTPSKLTTHERRCLDFSDAVDQATGEWAMRSLTALEQHARGGLKSTTVTEKVDARGRVMERTTKTEELLPNPAVIQWRLERRFPDRYGRQRVEVSGPEGEAIPIEVRATELAAKLAQIKEQRAS